MRNALHFDLANDLCRQHVTNPLAGHFHLSYTDLQQVPTPLLGQLQVHANVTIHDVSTQSDQSYIIIDLDQIDDN